MTARLNNTMATEAILIQMAVASLFSKDSGREFQKLINSMS